MRLTHRAGLGAIAVPMALAIAVTAAACTSDPAPGGAARPTSSTAPATTPEPTAVIPSQPRTSPADDPTVEPVAQDELDRRLIDAAWDNDVPRARALVARGADVNAQDDTQQSAFLIATSEGYDELLDLTLRHGADVDALDSFDGTGLIRAAERGHWSVVGRLVRAGVRLDHVNNLGWTALHEATTLGDGSERYVDTARVLVAAGVDVTIPAGRDGRTAVEMATDSGYAFAGLLGDAAEVTEGDRADRRPTAAGRGHVRRLRTRPRSRSGPEPGSRPGTSTTAPRCCWRRPTTTWRSPGCWSPWVPTRTRSTTATTPRGWSPA